MRTAGGSVAAFPFFHAIEDLPCVNAILRSITVATLLAMTVLSTGCSIGHATKPVAIDDTQAYVDGTISPVTASIDQSLQTLVILERGDEGPRKNGAIGDTIAGGSAPRAPRTVAVVPSKTDEAWPRPSVKPVPVREPVRGKELARLEHGADSASCASDSAGSGSGDRKNACSPSSQASISDVKRASEDAPPPGLRHGRDFGRDESLPTDPSRRPAEPASPQDGGASASREASAARAALNTRVRLHWEGSPASLLSQVAHAIGFNVQTEGRLEEMKVSVHEDDATVETVLRAAARQIDGKADIQVDTSTRTIWLVAVRRR